MCSHLAVTASEGGYGSDDVDRSQGSSRRPALALSASSTEAAPLRVMVEGDSISQGFAGDVTWRYWLAAEFRRQGVALEMVGPTTALRDGTQNYLIPFTQRAHASLSGSTLEWHIPQSRRWVETYQPDVVVVELGTNDIRLGDDAATVAEQTEALIRDEIWAADPTVRVKIVEIPGWPDPVRDQIAAQANAMVADRFAGDPLVSIVRIRNRAPQALEWHPRAHTWDGIHPNIAGQRLLGQRVAEWFYYDGTLPSYPSLRPMSQWRLGITPRPAAVGSSAIRVLLGATAVRFSLTTLQCEARRLKWSRTARAFRPVRSYFSPRYAGWSLSGSTSPSQSCLLRSLPRGRYQVRVRSSRVWAAARPTPWVSIRLR